MPLYKNKSSQKIIVFAWDTGNSTEKTGDAANITAQISIDGGVCAATDDTNPTELDATDAPGIYIFDVTQAETNGDLITLFAKSSTSDIKIEPVIIYTVVDGLTTQQKADVNTECDTAFTDYDPPTKTEMDSGFSNLNDISTSDVETAVETQITAANTELASIPSSTAGIRAMIQFLFEYFRNARTETAGAESLKKEDGTTELGSRTLTDDGTAFTRGEMN
jgi:hypothetical protein